MSASREPPTLLIRLRCRSCRNEHPSAFARRDPSTGRTTPELLIGGRWVSDVPLEPAPPGKEVVACLACGSPDPEADVFEVPPRAADAERNRHLIVAALYDALRLSERARERAAAQPEESVGPEVALGQLREMHERIVHLLAEAAERGYLQQALRAANARIGELLEDTRRACRDQRRRPKGVPARRDAAPPT